MTPFASRSRRCVAVVASTLLADSLVTGLPVRARAFVSVEEVASVEALAHAVRWSAVPHALTRGRSLAGGLQVGVEDGFAETLALRVTGAGSPADVRDIEDAVTAAFRAWESPVVRFSLVFGGLAVRDPDAGGEIDVFAAGRSDPLLRRSGDPFAATLSSFTFVSDRRLTNGTVSPGSAFTGSDIIVNVDEVAAAVAQAPTIFGRAFTREEQLAALTRLLIHEIGHALGLHHPNDFPERNFDRDSNPTNALIVDPTDPLAGLRLSSAVDADAVLSDLPAHLPDALLFTALRNDDRGGRDVLYPAPASPRRCGGGVHPPDEECEDGDPCNGIETCDLAHATCRGGAPLTCDDGDPCNGTETCEPGAGCQAGFPCIDASVCTIDTCDPATGCAHAFDTAACPVERLALARLKASRVGTRGERRMVVVVVRGPVRSPGPALPGTVALLDVVDATGRGTSFLLPRDGWRRAKGPGERRVVFRGKRRDRCRRAVLDLARGLRAVCTLPAGQLPVVPPIDVVLRVGVPASGATFYCASSAVAGSADGAADCRGLERLQ
jgi:hypothetical protein